MKLFHNFLVIFILLLYSSHFVSPMSQQSQSLLLHAAAIYALFTVYGIYQEKISHELKIFLLNYELFNLIYFVKVVGANVLCAGRLILVAK